MDKALFHSKYFPNFKTENQFADPYLKYCKVNICNDGNLQLRKKKIVYRMIKEEKQLFMPNENNVINYMELLKII